MEKTKQCFQLVVPYLCTKILPHITIGVHLAVDFQVHYVKSHNFQPQQFYTLTYCNHCQKMLWGVASFGYQCQSE